MPKRRIRKRRTDDGDDTPIDNEEEDNLLEVLADAAIPLVRGGKDRKHGISIFDADQASGKEEKRCGEVMDTAGAASDVLSQRMEEFVGSELVKKFQPPTNPSSADNLCGDETREDDNAVPSHLETKPVQEVSVPGFNKAITKVALKKDASGGIATEGAAGKKKRGEPDTKSVPWVDRAMFPSKFGRQGKI